jgi:hypothetical protein
MMKELLTALHKAKKEFKPIIKSANNPFFKSKYANLDTITDAIKEGLENNGLIILQPVQGNVLHTQIYHAESGEMLESLYNLPDLSDPQKLGSAITYARRYALCSFLGLVADEDDDGNVASGKSDVIDKSQLDKLQKLVTDKKIPKEAAKQVVLDFGYTNSSNILKEDFNKVYKEIEALGK